MAVAGAHRLTCNDNLNRATEALAFEALFTHTHEFLPLLRVYRVID